MSRLALIALTAITALSLLWSAYLLGYRHGWQVCHNVVREELEKYR